jgi:hypothetical protein
MFTIYGTILAAGLGGRSFLSMDLLGGVGVFGVVAPRSRLPPEYEDVAVTVQPPEPEVTLEPISEIFHGIGFSTKGGRMKLGDYPAALPQACPVELKKAGFGPFDVHDKLEGTADMLFQQMAKRDAGSRYYGTIGMCASHSGQKMIRVHGEAHVPAGRLAAI